MSNHHIKQNYFELILKNKEAIATDELGIGAKILTINIDLSNLESHSKIDISNIRSVIEKKSRDTLFLKTLIVISDEVIATSSSIWTKN